jgi:hypothetical protein
MDYNEKADRYRRKARHHDDMATALEVQDANRIMWIPKSVPRGHTPEWYRHKAMAYTQKAEELQEVADAMDDLEWRNHLEKLSPEQRRMVSEIIRGFQAMLPAILRDIAEDLQEPEPDR